MRLKELREKNNLKQQDVAKYLNKTKSGYGYYESGRTEPDISTLCKLADLYHVSIDELIGRKHNNFIDKGLLDNTQLSIINIIQQLNPIKLEKLEAYAYALYQQQHDEDEIKRRIKGE